MTWLRRVAPVAAVLLALGAAGVGLAFALAAPSPQTVAARAHSIESGLRCPVCQGLSVADSPSTVAAGMRRIVLAQLRAGRTPAQVRGYFTARYGSWILLDTPRQGIGWLVWLAPVLGVGLGALAIALALRRRKPLPPLPALPEAALARVEAAYQQHLAGEVFDREELDAALTLLAAVREDPSSETAAEEIARHRVAAALPTQPTEPAGPTGAAEPAEPATRATTAPVRRRRVRRRALLAAGAAFVLAAGLLLGSAIRPRRSGAPPTGDAKLVTDLVALRADARAHPDQESAWLALGLADDASGNLVLAYQDYQHAARIAPADLQPKLLIASVLVRGGSPAQAVALLRPLLASHPNDPNLLLTLGVAEHDAHQPTAAATLRRLLAVDPTNPHAAQVRALLAG